jgi:N-acetylmuramoyl-L-alanine amidase
MTKRLMAILLLALALAPATTVVAQTSAETLYTRALGRERGLRDASRQPTLKQLRGTIAAYETVVRRYPRSGYCDNALWQAANLAVLAYERYHQAADRVTATRLATQLRDHYPASALARRSSDVLAQVAAVRAEINRKPEARAVRAAGPATPPPAVAAVSERPAASAGAATPSPVTIRTITRSLMPDGVRVSIEMDGESPYYAERLAGPDRVFFDLKGAQAAPGLVDSTLKFDDSVVREIRLGRHPRDVTRVVMDMTGVEDYSVFTLYEPYRIVVDFKAAPSAVLPAVPPPPAPAVEPAGRAPVATTGPADAIPSARAASSAAADLKASDVDAPALKPLPSRPAVPPSLESPALPSANADGKFSLARQLGLGVSRIVIDAGHGGRDPGAQANGISEAELVLDVAQRLTKLLQKQTAIDVVMTRTADVFIPLEERTAIANREGADLFLSIHANAARNTKARGVETYFLNFASNPEAEAVAARENSASGRTMHSLPEIVRAIALNNKIDESRDFADTVQRAMVRRLSARNKALRNLGVKQAPFVVLIGAAMPSVLAEISFVTNKQEAQLLKTGAYRQQIAEALFDAVLGYQRSLKKARMARADSAADR